MLSDLIRLIHFKCLISLLPYLKRGKYGHVPPIDSSILHQFSNAPPLPPSSPRPANPIKYFQKIGFGLLFQKRKFRKGGGELR